MKKYERGIRGKKMNEDNNDFVVSLDFPLASCHKVGYSYVRNPNCTLRICLGEEKGMRSVKQKYIFTIDLGTSGPKVALVSPTGDLLDCEMDPVNVILLPDGGAEQRPEDWWQAVCTATHRLINKYHITPSDVTAISCTSQWSGTVPVGEDGKPLMNAIIWMDSRGSRYIRKITRGLVNIQGYDVIKMLTWISLTGGIPAHAGKDSIAHIIFIKHELP
ncbi:MAG: hypothetical protein EHM41_14530, partial [Chloroflexi bacterium]